MTGWHLLAVGLVAVGAAQTISLETVLDRATAYVETYERALGMLVAEEEYDQRVPANTRPVFPSGRPTLRGGAAGGWLRLPESRERRMRSDFLMLRLPGPEARWIGLRVALEVDGQEVDGVAERLQAALAIPTASGLEQWRTLAEESARFNLGDIVRTTNVPTFALLVLHPEHRDRFVFERQDTDRVEGREVWVVGFRESRGPTLITDPVRRVQVPTHGRVWVDPLDGRVVRTELRTGQESDPLRSEIVVRYAPHDTLGLWVPRDMRERYDGRPGRLFEGHARYGSFRRFRVDVETSLAGGAAPETDADADGAPPRR